jgi:hypothetical protein
LKHLPVVPDRCTDSFEEFRVACERIAAVPKDAKKIGNALATQFSDDRFPEFLQFTHLVVVVSLSEDDGKQMVFSEDPLKKGGRLCAFNVSKHFEGVEFIGHEITVKKRRSVTISTKRANSAPSFDPGNSFLIFSSNHSKALRNKCSEVFKFRLGSFSRGTR